MFAHIPAVLAAIGFGGRPDFYVGWLTLALINAGLAQSKNRSGLLWWLVSLFLGPIATFILVALLDRLPDSRLN